MDRAHDNASDNTSTIMMTNIMTMRSLTVAKRPYDCCMGQFWPNVTVRRYFADNIVLSLTTVTYLASKAIEFADETQNRGYYAVQGH